MQISTEKDFDAFVKQFQDHSLQRKSWTHEAHFVAGLWFVYNYGYDQAVDILRESIKTYNEATGVLNTEHDGYHETITLFYLKSISDFLAKQDQVDSKLELLTRLLNSEIVDRTYPFRFYSKDRLLSVEARLSWIEPDLI